MLERKEVEKLIELELVDMSDAEIEQFRGEIDAILGYVSELQTLSSGEEEEREPQVGELHNVMREDIHPHESGIYTEAILKELPQREGEYVKVKKILNNQ